VPQLPGVQGVLDAVGEGEEAGDRGDHAGAGFVGGGFGLWRRRVTSLARSSILSASYTATCERLQSALERKLFRTLACQFIMRTGMRPVTRTRLRRAATSRQSRAMD
jgi:hypothetical protein